MAEQHPDHDRDDERVAGSSAQLSYASSTVITPKSVVTVHEKMLPVALIMS